MEPSYLLFPFIFLPLLIRITPILPLWFLPPAPLAAGWAAGCATPTRLVHHPSDSPVTTDGRADHPFPQDLLVLVTAVGEDQAVKAALQTIKHYTPPVTPIVYIHIKKQRPTLQSLQHKGNPPRSARTRDT